MFQKFVNNLTGSLSTFVPVSSFCQSLEEVSTNRDSTVFASEVLIKGSDKLLVFNLQNCTTTNNFVATHCFENVSPTANSSFNKLRLKCILVHPIVSFAKRKEIVNRMVKNTPNIIFYLRTIKLVFYLGKNKVVCGKFKTNLPKQFQKLKYISVRILFHFIDPPKITILQ